MIWSDLHGDMKNQAETIWSLIYLMGSNKNERS